MSGPEQPGEFPDDLDLEILDRLADLHGALDGPPPGFDEQMIFALSWDASGGSAGLDAELARLRDEELVGARAGADEQTRTVTFEAPSLTILLTVVELAEGRVRVDGWLAPAAPGLQVEVRLAGERADRSVVPDDTGRFVVDDLPQVLVQLVVHRADDGPTVTTPSIQL